MASITIRNIPESLLKQVRNLSAHQKRSINSELLVLIENGLANETNKINHTPKKISIEAQLHIWQNLAGKWIDDRNTDTIISDIYSARTAGRAFKL